MNDALISAHKDKSTIYEIKEVKRMLLGFIFISSSFDQLLLLATQQSDTHENCLSTTYIFSPSFAPKNEKL